MYLGMIFIMVAAIFKLGNGYSFIALPLFLLYITRFQIKPEERIIERIIGEQYMQYKSKVRRWLKLVGVNKIIFFNKKVKRH
jgi:protein-S-isoprenylcysteine O-methyltransferase Ste14